MTQEPNEKKLAYLEFVHDQLLAELEDLDQLLRKSGFPDGVCSLKEVAQEMLEEEIQ